jgi:hypothetical protein
VEGVEYLTAPPANVWPFSDVIDPRSGFAVNWVADLINGKKWNAGPARRRFRCQD